MHFAIIGAGMAGLACADALVAAGHSAELFDKGRGPGGRMSTRRLQSPLGDVTIDHGAQYFTARDSDFCELVGAWQAAGLAEPWPAAGRDAWIGIPGMNAVIRQMAAAHAVTWGHRVTGMAREGEGWWLTGEGRTSGPYDAVLLAIPAEQAAALISLHDFAMARVALLARSQPCWTGMFVFDAPLRGLPPIIRDAGDVAWAARNGAKPGRSGLEAWVVQASAAWSACHLELDQGEIAPMLLLALAEATGSAVPEPVTAVAHRWRFALSAGTGDGALWNPALGLGACGDWLLGPRVECAWLSGRMLASAAMLPKDNPAARPVLLVPPAEPAMLPKGHAKTSRLF